MPNVIGFRCHPDPRHQNAVSPVLERKLLFVFTGWDIATVDRPQSAFERSPICLCARLPVMNAGDIWSISLL
jgi:hypothetical protein